MDIHLFKRTISSIIIIFLLLIILNLPNIFFYITLVGLFLICAYEWKKLSNNNFILFLGWLFLLFSIFSTSEIKNLNNNNNLIYFLLVISIGTDIGGYFFGKFIGGPKLTSISPNKTYAGVLGSLILVSIFVFLYFNIFELSVFKENNLTIEYYLLAIFLSFISQLGDLVISFFKRKSGVKDTGNIIPGHGGFLDRVDGMIFVFPIFYLLQFIINF